MFSPRLKLTTERVNLVKSLDKAGRSPDPRPRLNPNPETVNTPEIRVECPDHIKFKVVQEVTAYFKDRQDVIDIDGVRVLYPDGWGLVRASNTQPALVLRFEAMSANRLQEIQEEVESVLRDIQKQI